ncbi:MAG: branched-chain amino acid transporter permease [Ramlibacter sp.]|jgi:branched-chain amino acid transport system permease protein|nr:branched-chain amino acid transporter permease [Ramlibacter sp.]
MDSVAFVVFNGISYGLMLFLLSSGFTLVFGIMGVLNIAHATFFMLGAYFAYELSRIGGFWLGLCLAPIGVAILGSVIERHVLSRARGAGHLAELLVTFGLAYVLTEAVQLIWGRTSVPYLVPAFLDFPLLSTGGIQYSAYKVLSFGLTLLVFIVLFLVMRLTLIGSIIRAALTHPKMTAALGHNVPRLFNQLFAVGAGLAGLAGALAGNVLGTQPTMAIQLGALIFVVVVVGGLGSLGGALIASLLIGLVQTAAVSYPISLLDMAALLHLDGQALARSTDLRQLSTASIAPLLPYLLMIVLLLVRPRGLFGTRDV